MSDSLLAVLNLQLSSGVGEKTFRHIIETARVEGIALDEIMAMSEDLLVQTFGLKPDLAEEIAAPKAQLDDLASQIAEFGAQALVFGQPPYPSALEQRLGAQAPPLLFAWGALDLLDQPTLGVSGARNASELSVQAVYDLAGEAARDGIVVVSGYAGGVDSAAHLGAVEAGGRTIAVLPLGILNFQSRASLRPHFSSDNSLVLSQFPPRLGWHAHNAMARNGAICALSNAILLVEPGKSGGTMDTGREALRHGMPLFLAAPGGTPMGDGAPYFLQRGARPVASPQTEEFRALVQACRANSTPRAEQGAFF